MFGNFKDYRSVDFPPVLNLVPAPDGILKSGFQFGLDRGVLRAHSDVRERYGRLDILRSNEQRSAESDQVIIVIFSMISS